MASSTTSEPKRSMWSSLKDFFGRKKARQEAIEAEEHQTSAKDSAWKGTMNK